MKLIAILLLITLTGCVSLTDTECAVNPGRVLTTQNGTVMVDINNETYAVTTDAKYAYNDTVWVVGYPTDPVKTQRLCSGVIKLLPRKEAN